MNEQLIKFFHVPKEAYCCIELMLTNEEIKLIELLKDKQFTYQHLLELIKFNFDLDAKEFITNSYKRGVINKEILNDTLLYKSADVYTRLAYFAQFEENIWKSVSKENREKLDTWYVNKYAEWASPRLEEVKNGTRKLIENAHFFTLDETLNLIDEIDKELYLVPCNCRSVALKCDKPKNTCILFEKGINSPWDRGWGKTISKEEAKEIVTMADKNGLMHTSETEQAICNCDSCCCYPIRSSKIIGGKGLWPEPRYNIIWDDSKCVNCGKCAKICNFNAFEKIGKKVFFNKEKCWGCTICKEHCPTNAITLEKI